MRAFRAACCAAETDFFLPDCGPLASTGAAGRSSMARSTVRIARPHTAFPAALYRRADTVMPVLRAIGGPSGKFRNRKYFQVRLAHINACIYMCLFVTHTYEICSYRIV